MENQSEVATRPLSEMQTDVGTFVPDKILEVLMDRAARHPRDEQFALSAAVAELERVPKLAEKAYYSIPYADNSEGGAKKPVEGLTIGASMSMVRRWGNILTGGLIVKEDDRGWDLTGIAIDLETLTYNSRPYRVSKFYKPKGGDSMRPLVGQMKENKLLSGISKNIRTVALWTLPAWFRDEYFNAAKALVLHPPKSAVAGAKQESIVERLVKARGAFKKEFGIEEPQMQAYIDGTSFDDDGALLQHLIGLYNGLKEGTTSVEAVFGNEQPAPRMSDAGGGAAS